MNHQIKSIIKTGFSLIAFVWFFNCSQVSDTNKTKSNCGNSLPLIIYSNSNDAQFISSGLKNTKLIGYYTILTYPSKKVFNYYDEQLINLGFKRQMKSIGYSYKFGNWEEGYSIVNLKIVLHANLIGIWINPINKQIAWLHLFYDWTKEEWINQQRVIFAISDLGDDYIKYKNRALDFYNLQKWLCQAISVKLDKSPRFSYSFSVFKCK